MIATPYGRPVLCGCGDPRCSRGCFGSTEQPGGVGTDLRNGLWLGVIGAAVGYWSRGDKQGALVGGVVGAALGARLRRVAA